MAQPYDANYNGGQPWNALAGVPMNTVADPDSLTAKYGGGFGGVGAALNYSRIIGDKVTSSRAEAAANTAARAATANYSNEGRQPVIPGQITNFQPPVIPGTSDPQDQRPANVQAADEASRANWNTMVGRMTGMGVKNASGVMAPAYPGAPGAGEPGGIPTGDKAGGMAAIAAGGAPRLLNYSNSQIVGSGSAPGTGQGGPGKGGFNSFTGFGTQAPVDAHQQALDHVNDFLNRAAEASKNGDPYAAAQLQAQARRTANVMGALSTASYQAGHLGVMQEQNAQTAKREQPGITMDTAEAAALASGHPEMSSVIARGRVGGNTNPQIQNIAGGQYIQYEGESTPRWVPYTPAQGGIAGAAGADPNRGMPKPR